MILYEVGLENEYWLLNKDNNIMEAPAYNFPADEMGFLVEIRSAWGTHPAYIAGSITSNFQAELSKAVDLGLKLEAKAFRIVSREWQEYIAKKYKHSEMADNTRNVYGKMDVTHHTGFINDRATAGCHVHFSRWSIEKECYLPFTEKQIEFIVKSMDKEYGTIIGDAGRIAGEWEPKPYHGGFEYRSLPCTVSLFDVAFIALKILRKA